MREIGKDKMGSKSLNKIGKNRNIVHMQHRTNTDVLRMNSHSIYSWAAWCRNQFFFNGLLFSLPLLEDWKPGTWSDYLALKLWHSTNSLSWKSTHKASKFWPERYSDRWDKGSFKWISNVGLSLQHPSIALVSTLSSNMSVIACVYMCYHSCNWPLGILLTVCRIVNWPL